MRFRIPRRRRTQVRSAQAPFVTVIRTPANTATGTVATATNWRLVTGAADHPPQRPQPLPPQPEETPVPELSPRERKLYRVSTKREQRTAGQLAVRAGLQSADGSGRGVVRDLNALVAAGKLTRHGVKTPYSYTRAA